MKTSKEFWDRMANDEVFAKTVREEVAARREAGADNYYDTLIPVAADQGYELTKEELDEIMKTCTSELSEEELGKVSGGTSCPVLWTMIGAASIATLAITADLIQSKL